jgi:hypothetical protein
LKHSETVKPFMGWTSHFGGLKLVMKLLLLLPLVLSQRGRRTTSVEEEDAVTTTIRTRIATVSTTSDESTTPVQISTNTPTPTVDSRERSSASATFDGGKVGLVAGIIGGIVAILALGSFLYYHTNKEKKTVNETRIDLHNVPSKEVLAPAVPTMATYEIEVEVPAESVSGSTFTGGDYLAPQMYDRRPSNVSQHSYSSHAHYVQGPPPPVVPSVPYDGGYHYNQDYYQYQNTALPYYAYGPSYTHPDPNYQDPSVEGSQLSQVPAALLQTTPGPSVGPSPENASNEGDPSIVAPATEINALPIVQEQAKSPVHKGFSTL